MTDYEPTSPTRPFPLAPHRARRQGRRLLQVQAAPALRRRGKQMTNSLVATKGLLTDLSSR
jgi:hypothetical protein